MGGKCDHGLGSMKFGETQASKRTPGPIQGLEGLMLSQALRAVFISTSQPSRTGCSLCELTVNSSTSTDENYR